MARLMDAGLESFAELGWHDASIDDIVARADSSHGTFYLYFGNKQDLLLTLAHECADVMVELLDELAGGEPGEPGAPDRAAVRRWLERYLDAYEPYRGVVRAWMESQVDHPELAVLGSDVMTAFGARFRDVVHDADPRSPVDPALRAAALLALLERFSYVRASRGSAATRDEILDTLAAIVHRGFLRPPRRVTIPRQ
jgi:AcrR family transcriptional regulator